MSATTRRRPAGDHPISGFVKPLRLHAVTRDAGATAANRRRKAGSIVSRRRPVVPSDSLLP